MPGSRLVLKATQLADEGTRDRYASLFRDEGIAADRIVFSPRLPKTEEHLDLYRRIDIGLDPFPYNGTTTTCEALWMGVPVVALLGSRHAGRVGASILQRLGFEDLLLAADEDEYVNKAALLAQDVDRLAETRENLRGRMEKSPLCEAKKFASAVEAAYRKMWMRYLKTE